MAADRCPIEEQHRHIQAIAPGEIRIGINVHHFDRRQRQRLAKHLKLREHLVAELAALAVNEGETLAKGGQEATAQRRGACRDSPLAEGPLVGGLIASDLTEFAMNLTVSGGTSPTAVTL